MILGPVVPSALLIVKPEPLRTEEFPATSVAVTPSPFITVVLPAASVVVTLVRSVKSLAMFTTS